MVDELTQESFQTGKAIVTVSVDLITAFCEVKSIDQIAALLKMASEQVLEEQKEMTKILVL